MSKPEGIPTYTGEGSSTAGPGCVIGAVGGTVALAMLIVSFVIGDRIGPWWLWLLIVGAFILWGWWDNKRSKTKIELYHIDDEHMHLSITGPGAGREMKFNKSYVANWYTYEHMRAKHGGGVLVVYFIVMEGVDKQKVVFKQMIGAKGSEAYGWKYGDMMLAEDENMFHIMDIVGFINAIRRPKK